MQLNEWRDQIAAFAVNPADPSDNILRSTGTASTNTTMTLYRRPSGATIAPTNAPTNARRSAADISEETHAAEGAAGGAAYAPGRLFGVFFYVIFFLIEGCQEKAAY